MTEFRSLLEALGAGGVDFIVIGGFAATAHGSARLTQDLDVVYERSPHNVERLAKALAPYKPYLRGAPAELPFEWSAATILRGLNFTLATSLGDIDVFGEIVGGGGYPELAPHTVTLQLFGRDCLCLDLPTLIRVKRAAGRPRDFDAVAELEALLEENGTD